MDIDVLVAGAGPVGLFLAAELRLAGARVTVLEQLATPSTARKARGIGVLATEALARRGLGARLAEADVEGTRDLEREHGSVLGHFAGIHKLDPALADPGRHATRIWQPELERLLSGHAESLGVRVERGHEVTGFVSDVDGVTVTARAEAGERRLRAAFLVGCDGGRSTVRKLGGFAFPGTPPLLRTVAGRVRFAEPAGVPAAGRYPTGDFLRGGDLAGVTEPATASPEAKGPVSPAELATAIERVTGVPVPVETVDDGRRFGDQARQVTEYRRGRVLLAGDAAHVHSPSGGQGLNLGLLDAANLGWKLAAVAAGTLPDAVLDTYGAERHPAGAAVLRNTRAQSALLAPGAHVDALREILAEVLDRPGANRYFSELLSGTGLRHDFPYAAGLPSYVGQHSPDLEPVNDDGRRSRLSEHTRTGRGLLLLGPGDRGLAAAADGRVDVLAVRDPPSQLIRPDGVVAWAGDPAVLPIALDTWFGRSR
ncbi:FAD-dependent monooxygenase [Amycolatopsis sp. NBC_00345]|uniref:FAD-dependent monooxygenase n=1 Tax=Amycolatopsis sp. NBC_00345 TaxID=2975955 RepID=UPI002E25FA31